MAPPVLRPTIETREDVMFFDTDCGGVVHNLAYLRMIESCRTRLGTVLGLSPRGMVESGRFAVVLRTEIDYRRPAVLADHLLIRGRLETIERVRFWCAFEIERPADGALLCACRQSLALVQLPAGRPVRVPDMWSERWPDLVRGAGRTDD
jgi:YbgC/YbaW family acyl-CoA thioester hydrolase